MLAWHTTNEVVLAWHARDGILTVLVLLDRIIVHAVTRGCMSSGGGNAFDALAHDSADWLFCVS